MLIIRFTIVLKGSKIYVQITIDKYYKRRVINSHWRLVIIFIFFTLFKVNSINYIAKVFAKKQAHKTLLILSLKSSW